MGQELYCDFCRKTVPVADALTPILVGDQKAGDACLNCSSNIKTQLNRMIGEAAAAIQQAQVKAQAQAAPPIATSAPVEEVPPRQPGDLNEAPSTPAEARPDGTA